MITRLRATALAATAVVGLVLTGCASSDPLAEQYREGTTQGYISGTGAISTYAEDDRGEPVSFTGETTAGESFDSANDFGEVTVVNFWYAGCPPCRAEAPYLEEVHEEYADENVTFIGVNVRDSIEQAQAFEKRFEVGYPSVLDAQSGAAQLAFAGTVAANAVPTTLVLDDEGRVAARILGMLDSASALSTIVGDELENAA